MKTSLLKTIRQPGEPRSGKLNYKLVTFITCLVLATVLWFLNVLSKKYEEPLTFYVSYQNMPKDKRLYPSSDTVRLKVSTSGFRLMAYKLGISEAAIQLDLNQFRHNYYYTFNSTKHAEKLQEQLGDAVKILSISPDTLFMHDKPVNTDAN